jgi:hypothetical protein
VVKSNQNTMFGLFQSYFFHFSPVEGCGLSHNPKIYRVSAPDFPIFAGGKKRHQLPRKTMDSADAVPPEIEKPLVVHEEIPEAAPLAPPLVITINGGQ